MIPCISIHYNIILYFCIYIFRQLECVCVCVCVYIHNWKERGKWKWWMTTDGLRTSASGQLFRKIHDHHAYLSKCIFILLYHHHTTFISTFVNPLNMTDENSTSTINSIFISIQVHWYIFLEMKKKFTNALLLEHFKVNSMYKIRVWILYENNNFKLLTDNNKVFSEL